MYVSARNEIDVYGLYIERSVKLRAGETQPDSLAGVVVSGNRGGVRSTRNRSHDYSRQGVAHRRPADPGGRIRIAFANGVHEEALMMNAFDI